MVTDERINVEIDTDASPREQRRKMEAAAWHLLGGKVGMDPLRPYSAPQVVGMEYCPAPDLACIADQLIHSCSEFAHLRELHDEEGIVYLWKQKGGTSQGQATLGKCEKTSGLAKHFSNATWVVWLAADWCNSYSLTRRQVEALLHHELSHASEEADEQGIKSPKVAGHDFDGFLKNVERYGAWSESLQLCQNVWQQLDMFNVAEG